MIVRRGATAAPETTTAMQEECVSSTENAIKAVVLTFVVSALCFLPPVLHFITGPLGPGIGGYVAGNRFRVTALQAVILGIIVGASVGLLGPWLILSFNHLHFSGNITTMIYGFAMLYTGLLSGCAAWFGGMTAADETAS